ncbi:MAG: hypothetical protein LC620_05605 [Halobacteriales archaeon]|nr:hypothetical protein [Halobacteriales archaeon]
MATEMAPDAGGSDPLRRTLDTLHLDPNAAAERPYLESMLRRLGYTESEIQAYLGNAPGAAVEAPASTTAPDTGAERQIEVEYTGPGLKDFKLVVGVEQSELPAIQAGEAGTEVFEAGPSMEEVDRLVAEGGFGDFDDWGDTTPKEDAVGELGEAGAPPAEGEKPAEGEAPAIQVEKGSEAGTEIGLPEKPPTDLGPDFQKGESLVEFKPVEFNEPDTVVVPDQKAAAEELKEAGWDVADPATGEFEIATWELEEASAEEAPSGPYQYKDWSLYSRDELRGDQPQRIYFFSKGAPEGSEPAALPSGYEVAENPDTGRPFLRRAEESSGFAPTIDAAHPSAEPGAAPKKRVRILRVRAASREEAVAKLQAEGRNVIASMPIDIEKRFGE